MKVFIDGENLRHRLVSVLLHSKNIGDSEDYFRADVRALVTKALGGLNRPPEQISYYTTRIRQPEFEVPERLHDQITGIQESHRRWIAELTNQGVRVVKAGLLKVKENAPCHHCGRRTMVLQEKGVDVRMATEMVMAAIHDDVDAIVVMSSDADMIPALEVIKRSDTKIIYLCFEDELNQAVSMVSDQTVTYSRQDVINVFSPHRKAGDDK